MTSILIDMETGDPYLNETDNTVEVSQEDAFKQIINGLFNCQKGTEIMNPRYGFDLQTAIRESGQQNVEMFIESLVSDALQSEQLIGNVNFVTATRTSDGMTVEIDVESVIGERIKLEEVIGE